MRQRSRSTTTYQLVFAVGVVAAICVLATSFAAADTPSRSSYVANPPFARITSVEAQPADGPTQCHLADGFDYYCYSPANMRAVYDIPSGPRADGSGQTIVVVVAYGSSTIKNDLAAFDSTFHLPDPSLTIIGQNGTQRQNDPVVQEWVFETSLDVEWAHAIAPGANIVLAVAQSDDSHAINKTLAQVVGQYPGAIISQSFGTDETFVKAGLIDDRAAHRLYASAAALGDTVLASTGDFGASGIGGTSIVASYPASDPLVTAVGGTQGSPGVNGLWVVDPKTGTGGYGAEQAWNETFPFPGASGGAPSQIFPSPDYQSGLGYAKRTVPDVSYNASVAAGVIGIVQGDPYTFGGTSAGPPQWAGIFAIGNQQRAAANEGPLGPVNPVLYSHPHDLHDITLGDNVFDASIGGYSAGAGYDLATGLGTPKVASLLPDLLAAPGAPNTGAAEDATCQDQQLSGLYRNVDVPLGSWCDLANATVTGDVNADQASGLGITGSTISGNVYVTGTSGAADPSHLGLNVLCNTAVFGSVQIAASAPASPWSVGGEGCAASPDVTGSTGSVIAYDLRFNGNAATGSDVGNNTIGRHLQCKKDAGVTGSGNLVGGVNTGQCTASPLPG